MSVRGDDRDRKLEIPAHPHSSARAHEWVGCKAHALRADGGDAPQARSMRVNALRVGGIKVLRRLRVSGINEMLF